MLPFPARSCSFLVASYGSSPPCSRTSRSHLALSAFCSALFIYLGSAEFVAMVLFCSLFTPHPTLSFFRLLFVYLGLAEFMARVVFSLFLPLGSDVLPVLLLRSPLFSLLCRFVSRVISLCQLIHAALPFSLFFLTHCGLFSWFGWSPIKMLMWMSSRSWQPSRFCSWSSSCYVI
jgi:hypothetical protein